MFRKLLFSALVLLLFSQLKGQNIITPDSHSSYTWDFERIQDSSELMLHYAIKAPNKESIFNLTDPLAKISYNSAYPRGYNDGPVWKGKGLTTELHAVFSGSFGNFSYTFQPVVYYSQNLSYELAPNLSPQINPYNYQFVNFASGWSIDWVQKHGSGSFVSFHPGQSEIKFATNAFKASVTSQNLIFGPAIFSPIILSSNAPGTLKFLVGTNGPINIGTDNFEVGKLEANVLYGLMEESAYFDENSDNNLRYLNGLFLGFSPAFAPNLSIGFNKVLYKQTKFWDGADLYAFLFVKDEPLKVINGDTITAANDFFDQAASLSMDWKFPSVGFRAYAEYALNDFHGSRRWTLLEPEHSRGYTIGFQKLFESQKSDWILSYEHTNLSINHTYRYRATPPFYTHQFNKQGYTHQGQIMGAGIGPGGNGDFLEVKSQMHESGTVFGAFIQRLEHNKDYFITNDPFVEKHNVEYTMGGSFFVRFREMIYGIEASYSDNLNRYYEVKNDEQNLFFALSAKYRLRK